MAGEDDASDIGGRPDDEHRGSEVHPDGTSGATGRDGEAIDAFRAAAGGWVDLVDGDELIRQIYADREIAERPPVEL